MDMQNTCSCGNMYYIAPYEVSEIQPFSKLSMCPACRNKESDPNGIPAHEPGAKLDAGKPHAELLLDFSHALSAVADVCTYGAKKYSRGGWQHVENANDRYTGALMRHLLAEKQEPKDADTGLLHAAHLAWNALARLELMLRGDK